MRIPPDKELPPPGLTANLSQEVGHWWGGVQCRRTQKHLGSAEASGSP